MTTGRTSFAFDGVGGTWEWYQEEGRNVPLDEIKRHAQSLHVREGPVAEADFMALIRFKLKRATQGLLRVPEDGRAQLHRVPGVMEIKWGLEEAQWRLYYGEPARLYARRVMLGLYFDQKSDLDQQDHQIDEAARRWGSWQARQTY